MHWNSRVTTPGSWSGWRAAWMGFRWRSSWPRRGSARSASRCSPTGWPRAWTCCRTFARSNAGADVEPPFDVDVSTFGVGRHDSLIATLEWSMTMLPARERTLLGLVAQLSGPFPMAIVQAMVGAAGVSIDAVVGMARLVEANLVQVHQDEVWCYSTLETIRVFGRGLLDESPRPGLEKVSSGGRICFAGDIWARRLSQEAGMHVEVVRFLPLVRAALQEARDRGEVAAQRRIIVGLEGWSVWREQPEVWAWISELAVREPAEHADAGVLRIGRRGRVAPRPDGPLPGPVPALRRGGSGRSERCGRSGGALPARLSRATLGGRHRS